ncbi:MAG: PH domain-containing protein [Cellulosilyticaceae bacterium]|uniref:PH domain-containing protein n=1 Tax=Niameybacter sp. TaxID=2033640 RepID=UPI002FC5C262
MGLFGSSKTNNTSHFDDYLIDGEIIEAVYRLVLDEICFTNKRIIFVDKEALSTKKQLVSIPYHSIYYFGVEKGGIFELDNEIKLYTKGTHFTMEFTKGTNILEVEKLLATHIC